MPRFVEFPADYKFTLPERETETQAIMTGVGFALLFELIGAIACLGIWVAIWVVLP